MKYVKAIFAIFGISMMGEVLNQILPLPVPAGVYGLFILLIGLCTGVIKLDVVDTTGNFLLDTMPLMFVPISVGLMESFDQMRAILFPIFMVSIVSTVVVMAVTGKTADWIIKKKINKGEKQN